MKTEGKKWFAGLRTYIDECREKRPIVDRAVLSTEDENQCRIIGDSLLSWLQNYAPPLIEERAILPKIQKWEDDPFIVFTSEQPGLVAAREILGEKCENRAFLAHIEFLDWLKRHPDPYCRWHIHYWSFFAPVDTDTAKKAEKFHLSAGESIRLHQEGTMIGKLLGLGGDALWKWNGKELELLEKYVNSWAL